MKRSAHPRSAFGAPPQGGDAGGPAKPVPRRLLGAGLLLVLAVALQGCSSIQPWVKPYEREKLSDPIMQFTRAPLADKHREHIHTVREGARGATGVQGGGCGCN
jgi:hypothetical protein